MMMRLRSFLTFALLAFAVSPTFAGGVQDIEKLRQHVLNHASEHYKTSFGEKKFNESMHINVGRLDSRLRLAQCDNNLTFKIQEPPQNIRNITVKTTCEGPRRWTVYVPATIDMFAEILVTSRSLQKGDVLTKDDLEFRRVNIATIGHGVIEDFGRASGMELKRPLKAGDVLKLNHLAQPDIVHKGQTVIVSSKSKFLSVETSGIALVSGHLGQQIKVKNQRSNRVVDAKIVAPGRVIVALR